MRHRVQGTPASAAPEPIDPASLPPCEPLARLLSDIATVWAAERFAVELGARADELLESPEALSAFAARHDIDIVFENRTVASLAQADLPAVMLTRVGTGRMLVGRTEHRFVGRSDGRTYEIDHATLQSAAIAIGAVYAGAQRSQPAFGHMPEYLRTLRQQVRRILTEHQIGETKAIRDAVEEFAVHAYAGGH